ncbi:PepSY domain-containing protein [Bradyrhizobium sp. WSM 1704]|uniref:PepSY-associated TM helix domain-containing protein n=1 Tax=Bradyrhizobium semiaridum TaxID=2821404 RepID=UPI001CE32542|nr:PepSY-associated TM helix domain-containing protein [Bradyrhizobium semiaridum]MCA6123396.1 PepSY domain-containing protein [Bradyrhizobium semiaridum]
MTRAALRRWFWVHKWSSLVCTLFLLLVCVTGLPLVVRDELSDLFDNGLPYAEVAPGTPRISFDKIVAASRQMYPGEVITSMFEDEHEPNITVLMASSWEAFKANPRIMHSIRFDAHTGKVLKEAKPFDQDNGFFTLMLRLHKDMFAGLPGELFLGLMTTLFVAALVSGTVIYSPFMRRLDFGTVRSGRSPRLKWLDLHNLLGVVALGWMLVVGVTGIINDLSTPLFALWQKTDVKAMLDKVQDRPITDVSELSSQQAALDTARAALPDKLAGGVVFPGSPFGTPYHYVIWTRGKEPLTSRLFSPALVDARTGAFVAEVEMPWYLQALELSRPLHFGDYGGMPLKIIWILLDLVTIVVLVSGLYLWLSRRSSPIGAAEQDLIASHAARVQAGKTKAAHGRGLFIA